MGSLYGRSPVELERLRGAPLTLVFKAPTGLSELKGFLYNVDPVSGTVIVYHGGGGGSPQGPAESDDLAESSAPRFTDIDPVGGQYSVVLSDSVLDLRFG